jgi:hypothetical protein
MPSKQAEKKSTVKSASKKGSKQKNDKNELEEEIVEMIPEVHEEIPVIEEVQKESENSVDDIPNMEEEEDDNKSQDSSTDYFTNIINHLQSCYDSLGLIELDIKNIKNNHLNKDFIQSFNDLNKKTLNRYFKIQHPINDIISKEASSSLKDKEKKSDKKNKTTKKDNSNHPINKKMETFSEVLVFMELPEDTLISRADIQRKICAFIKTEKDNKNPDIFVENNDKRFKIIGPLKTLFEFIVEESNRRNLNETLPEELGFTDIMKYLKYCFPIVSK